LHEGILETFVYFGATNDFISASKFELSGLVLFEGNRVSAGQQEIAGGEEYQQDHIGKEPVICQHENVLRIATFLLKFAGVLGAMA